VAQIPRLSRLLSHFSRIAARVRSLLRGIARRDEVESEMREEFRTHIQLRTDDLIRDGLSRDQAARRAHREFGHMESYREEARGSRGLHILDRVHFSWLDVKLGFRMLRKHPGLSVISGLALAGAVAVAVLLFETVWEELYPTLPLDEGDRIVRIESWNAADSEMEPRSLWDFERWRDGLGSFERLGAYRGIERNLITPEGRREPVRVAEITASAFPITRVPPRLGRPLTAGDERPGAPDVAVLGFDVWQARFLGDPDVIGESVQLGSGTVTVVGVMPEGFGFPVDHQAWVPFRATATGPGEGPPIQIFGRLAEDATFESAKAELAAIGARSAGTSSGRDARLRPRLANYAGLSPGEGLPLQVLLMLTAAGLIVLATCANVATLFFARTALRETEILSRTALGATRWRIVGQLLVEALVLASVATAAGLAVGMGAIRWVGSLTDAVSRAPPPFWRDATIEPATVAWAIILALVCGALVGILPAIKATGGEVRGRLQRMGVDGAGMKFGGVWSALIIAQVTFTVLCLPVAIGISFELLRDRSVRSAFPTERYLTFRLELDREDDSSPASASSDDAYRARFDAVYGELERRLLEEPEVTDVTAGNLLPGMEQPLRVVETQQGSEPPVILRANRDGVVGTFRVEPGFFAAFEATIVAGRSFGTGDVGPGSRAVIVNESFARNMGGTPLGGRVRYAARGNEDVPGEWYEIVGVAQNMEMEPTDLGEADLIFRPGGPADLTPLRVAVRTSGDAGAFAPQLRRIVDGIDPALRSYEVRPLDDVVRARMFPFVIASVVAATVVLLAVLMSAAGLFALMDVSVVRRTREIGIRRALGAHRWKVLVPILKRAAFQVGAGIGTANLFIFLLVTAVGDGDIADMVVPLAGISMLMALVGSAACAIPAWRALKIQPTEALREA